MEEAVVCLWAQLIENDEGGIGVGRQARGLRDENGGGGGGRGIDDASEMPEMATEAVGDRRRARRIYNNDGGVGGGI